MWLTREHQNAMKFYVHQPSQIWRVIERTNDRRRKATKKKLQSNEFELCWNVCVCVNERVWVCMFLIKTSLNRLNFTQLRTYQHKKHTASAHISRLRWKHLCSVYRQIHWIHRHPKTISNFWSEHHFHLFMLFFLFSFQTKRYLLHRCCRNKCASFHIRIMLVFVCFFPSLASNIKHGNNRSKQTDNQKK